MHVHVVSCYLLTSYYYAFLAAPYSPSTTDYWPLTTDRLGDALLRALTLTLTLTPTLTLTLTLTPTPTLTLTRTLVVTGLVMPSSVPAILEV